MNIGEKHGRLTCIGKDETKDSRYYLFQCDCGNIKSIISYNVERGTTKSCGCIKKEHPNHTTFGFSHTRIDNIYKSMISRCNCPKNNRYEIYGGRGIKVCEEWEKDKTTFFEWAFANGYREDLTLDRIDNEKGYSPDNCRWVTYTEQANNKRNNRILEYKGSRMTMAQWERQLGFNKGVIGRRLCRGWSVDKALSTPINN